MGAASRLPSSGTYEAVRAVMSMAGIRQILQANISATNGADTTYTVQDPGTRRVIFIHASAGSLDIRFNINAAASASTIPIIPTRYVVVDAHGPLNKPTPPGQSVITVPADVLHFFNTTGSPVTIFIMEIE